MKYAHLCQIADFLQKYKKISSIRRIGDMSLQIFFDKDSLIFDLSKSNSAIYKNDSFMPVKAYQAPFDNLIKKRLNGSKIACVQCLKNNRILKFESVLNGSYKSLKTFLYLEFTGRFTNVILTDENNIILEALRHIDNSYRKIEVGEKLVMLEPFEIKEKKVDFIIDFDSFFVGEFIKVNKAKFQKLKEIKVLQNQKKIDSIKYNISLLESQDALMSQSNKYSSMATLLLANLSNLNGYDRNFSLVGFDGDSIEFKLEDTPKISANKFFTLSKRLKAKANGVEQELKNLNEKLGFYKGIQKLLDQSKSIGELEVILPKKKSVKELKDKSDNIQNFYLREFKISVGKSEVGNIFLLKNAGKNDIWLHLKEMPSPHVIIKSNKQNIDDDVLEFAAKVCLNFSMVGAGRYEIDYTKRLNVKVQNGAHVNYVNYKTILLVKD